MIDILSLVTIRGENTMFTLHPCDGDFIDSLDLIIKLIGGIGGVTLFLIGFSRYKKDQLWKRSEFIAKEIKEFNDDKMVRNAMYMLDWGARKIELFPEKANYDDRFATVNREVLNNALQFHLLRIKQKDKDRFTPVEVAIRDNFDRFLNYFERFEQFLLAELISEEEVKPYIDYWITTISEDLEESTKQVLYNFINEYKFKGTQNLFKRFGKNIEPLVKSSDLAGK